MSGFLCIAHLNCFGSLSKHFVSSCSCSIKNISIIFFYLLNSLSISNYYELLIIKMQFQTFRNSNNNPVVHQQKKISAAQETGHMAKPFKPNKAHHSITLHHTHTITAGFTVFFKHSFIIVDQQQKWFRSTDGAHCFHNLSAYSQCHPPSPSYSSAPAFVVWKIRWIVRDALTHSAAGCELILPWCLAGKTVWPSTHPPVAGRNQQAPSLSALHTPGDKVC